MAPIAISSSLENPVLAEPPKRIINLLLDPSTFQ